MPIQCRLRYLMAERKIRSVRALSMQVPVSYQTLNALYKNETTRIDFRTIEALCRFLRCRVGDLLVWDGEPPEGPLQRQPEPMAVRRPRKTFYDF
nr:MAG: hypothetical protein KatS3mg041_0823 [Bacteroidota bacterium]